MPPRAYHLIIAACLWFILDTVLEDGPIRGGGRLPGDVQPNSALLLVLQKRE